MDQSLQLRHMGFTGSQIITDSTIFSKHCSRYRQTSNVRRTLEDNKIIDGIVCRLNTWLQYIAQRQLQDEEKHLN